MLRHPPAVLTLTLLLGPGLLMPGRAAAQAGEARSTDPARTAIVRLSSPQPGARVYIDNVEVGETPISRYVEPGSHTIRITTDFAEPFVRRIEATAGATVEVRANFLPGTGSVEFAPAAPGAQVTIDGGAPVPTPVRLHDLPEGKHRYRIEAEGFEPFEGTLQTVRGRNYLVAPTLQRGDGMVSIRSVPDGLEVWLDGASVGITPLTLEDVPPGKHTVRVLTPDGVLLLRELDNSSGAKTELSLRAPDTTARLTVLTGSRDAVVRLSGEAIGTGKKVRLAGVERGEYLLSVEAEGADDVARKVVVPAEGSAWYTAELAEAGGASTLREGRPLTRRWGFWTAVGAGAAGVGAGTVLVAAAIGPVDVPEPAAVVTLP
jgi:hypothetical protein